MEEMIVDGLIHLTGVASGIMLVLLLMGWKPRGRK